MNDYKNNTFYEEHQEYTKCFQKGIKLQDEYDKARVDARCSACSIYIKNEGFPQEQWVKECYDKKNCQKVIIANNKLVENEINKDEIKNRYASKVFSFFSKQKPMLLRRKDKITVSWEDAFGQDYDSLEKGLRNSLVALIEESGGRYRILQM